MKKGRIYELCDEIQARKIDIDWTIRTRVDCVDDKLLKRMAEAGCKVIMYGIESGDKWILKSLEKDVNVDHIRRSVRTTADLGMKALGFFMVGAPGETPETAMNTIKLAKELPLEYCQFTKVTPFPNTEIYDIYMKEYGQDYWREFTKDPSIERELPLVGTDMTVEEAQRYVKKAYMAFYFRPKYVLKKLARMRSWMEFKNSASAAAEMMFSRQTEDAAHTFGD